MWTAGGSVLTGGHTGDDHSYRPRKDRQRDQQETKRRDACTSTRGTLTCFTDLAHKTFSTTTPVEAHTHATVPARFLTLNQF